MYLKKVDIISNWLRKKNKHTPGFPGNTSLPRFMINNEGQKSANLSLCYRAFDRSPLNTSCLEKFSAYMQWKEPLFANQSPPYHCYTYNIFMGDRSTSSHQWLTKQIKTWSKFSSSIQKCNFNTPEAGFKIYFEVL